MHATRLLLATALVMGPSARASGQDIADSDAAVTENRLRADVRFLAHDLLEGRGVGTRGDALARLFLATRLEALGVAPAGTDASFEQPVPIVGLTSTVADALVVASGERRLELTAPADHVAWAGRPDETTAWQGAEVVFVGYGIDAPEQEWDDYGQVDVAGKVLLFLNDDPDWDPQLFAGKVRLYYGRWSYKYEEAARRGAVGAIVIHTTPSAGYPFQVIQSQHEKEQYWLPFDDDAPSLAIRAWCSEDAARQVCALGGEDLDTLRERARSRDFEPVSLGVTASLRLTNETRRVTTANVAGIVHGSDRALADEVVVVTAHFDHLGTGPARRDDTIYNGAVDNAAGCAAVLAIAAGIERLPEPPRRSVMFLFPTAEESGLLGTKWFARHPTVPLDRVVANYNFDFMNVWGRTEDVQVVGHGKNTLTDVLETVAARQGRRIAPYSRPDTGMFYRSDHFELARVGVPAVLLAPGDDFVENREGRRRLKASFVATRYHTPQDEYDERWNLAGMVEDVRLVLAAVLATANADARPSWVPGDEFAGRR